MPQINQAFSTKTLTLPSYPESQVEILNTLSVNDLMEVESIENKFESSVLMAVKLIKNWNFDEEGKPLPVSAENVKRLPASDLAFLINELTVILDSQKKTPSEMTK